MTKKKLKCAAFIHDALRPSQKALIVCTNQPVEFEVSPYSDYFIVDSFSSDANIPKKVLKNTVRQWQKEMLGDD